LHFTVWLVQPFRDTPTHPAPGTHPQIRVPPGKSSHGRKQPGNYQKNQQSKGQRDIISCPSSGGNRTAGPPLRSCKGGDSCRRRRDFHLDLAPLIDCRPQRKAVTSDRVVPTFTKKRKGEPAPAFIFEVWVARTVVVVAAGGLRAGRYRSSAGTRPSDRSDPSDGRRR
jgi:hypothetical protein